MTFEFPISELALHVHRYCVKTGCPIALGFTRGGVAKTAFALIIGLFLFLRHRSLRSFTPLLFPFLYAIMVYLEAPISGTSTNPARSLGPAVISGDWSGWRVYWIGPVLGTLAAVAIDSITWLRRLETEVPKLFHFEHDPHGIFRWRKPR